jgi:hypothetical protein
MEGKSFTAAAALAAIAVASSHGTGLAETKSSAPGEASLRDVPK